MNEKLNQRIEEGYLFIVGYFLFKNCSIELQPNKRQMKSTLTYKELTAIATLILPGISVIL